MTTPLPLVIETTAPWAGREALRTARAHHATALLANGDPEAALPLLTAALDAPGDTPANAVLLVLRSHASECAGLLDGAITDLIHASTEVRTLLPGVADRLHVLLDRSSDGAGSLLESWAAEADVPGPEANLLRVHAAVLTGDSTRAQDALRSYLEWSPVDGTADDPAVSLLERLSAGRPGDQSRHLALTGLFAMLGDTNRALAEIDQVLDTDPAASGDDDAPAFHAQAYELQADLLDKLGRREEANKALFHAGRAWYWREDYDRAIPLLETAASGLPGDAAPWWTLADCQRVVALRPLRPNLNLLRTAAASWEEGRRRAVRTDIPDWAYKLRAALAESLADADTPGRIAHLLAGVAALEDLIATSGDGSDWAWLTRFHINLQNIATAHCTVSSAPEADGPAGTELAGEQARIAVALMTADATTLVDRYVGDDAASPHLAGWLLFNSGRAREAIRPLERAAELSDSIDQLELLGLALQQAGEHERARSTLAGLPKIWEALADKSGLADRVYLAETHYHLGDYRACRTLLDEIVPRLAERPGFATDVLRLLTLVHLASGDRTQATETFREALAHPLLLPFEADTLARDLDDLGTALRGDPGRVPDARLAAELATDARAALPALQDQPRDADAALGELRAGLQRPGQEDTATVACHAGMARLLSGLGRPEEMAHAALELLRGQPKSPVAASRLPAAADELIRAGNVPLARRVLAEAVGLVPEGDHELAGDLLFRLALAAALTGEEQTAEQTLARGFDAYESAGYHVPGDVPAYAAGIWCQDLGDPRGYWRLRHGLGDQSAGPVAELADQCLAQLLRVDKSDDPLASVPLTTPIAVEIADSLVPEDTSAEGPMIGTYIPEMRGRIITSMTGTPGDGEPTWLPGIRVRVGAGLVPGGFRILLHEVVRHESAVPEGMAFCLASPDDVAAHGIEASPAVDPVTRAPAAWIPASQADQAEAAKIEVWRDPLLFVFSEVEHQLRRYLDEYLTLDEVAVLHERWKSAFRDSAVPDVGLERLTAMVRELVRGRAPVTDPVALLRAAAAPRDLEDAVDVYRQAMAASLPGNADDMVRVSVPPRLAALAAAAAGEVPLAGVLFDALAELRNTLADLPDRVALVAADGAARRAVGRYIRAEYPDVPVLSEQEVSTGPPVAPGSAPTAQGEAEAP